jgi:SAM-dependent methyltransferase
VNPWNKYYSSFSKFMSLRKRMQVSESQYKKDKSRFKGDSSLFAKYSIKFFPSKSLILDLGCGRGRDSQFFLNKGHRVIGIDYSRIAIMDSKSLFANKALFDLILAEALFFMNSIRYDTLDVVYSNLVYNSFFIFELKELFNLIHKILKKDGIHAYCVRSIKDPHFMQGKSLSKYTKIGGSHKVPYTYFSHSLINRISKHIFTPIDLFEDNENFLFFVIQKNL